MTTHDLTRRQMEELKRAYLCETRDSVSWNDLANADALIPDKTIHHYYDGFRFSPDDFSS